MNREAAFGIAAHFSYKEGAVDKTGKVIVRKLDWVKQLSELHRNRGASGEYLENLRTDFFEDRVFVFTPKGDVVDLPFDSSPIDFAYAIHSDIGDHTSGAKVNNKLVGLDTELKNGDIVEIITNKSNKPTQKWLDYAKTSLARRRIRTELTNQKTTTTKRSS